MYTLTGSVVTWLVISAGSRVLATPRSTKPESVTDAMKGGRLNDRPKSLRDLVELDRRRARLNDPHVAPLTKFVEKLHHERHVERKIPYFDPLDGGINARVLFVLEAPGPKAVESGFVSRNNPDESAKNFFLACQTAGLRRRDMVVWNIVPWYIGDGTKIRAATVADIEEGLLYLARLLVLLPKLNAVVLVGRKAQRIETWLRARRPDLRLFNCPHPSPVFVNRRPENRERLLSALRAVVDGKCSA